MFKIKDIRKQNANLISSIEVLKRTLCSANYLIHKEMSSCCFTDERGRKMESIVINWRKF